MLSAGSPYSSVVERITRITWRHDEVRGSIPRGGSCFILTYLIINVGDGARWGLVWQRCGELSEGALFSQFLLHSKDVS